VYGRSARFYDALYHFKDYAAAAGTLIALLEREHPGARTLLDVACGTGRHLEHLQSRYEAEGADISAALLEAARQRCPRTAFHEGDMVTLDLGRRYDVVTCLFSAIAYTRTSASMHAAVAAMGRHVEPSGVLVIEPWFTPDVYRTGTITSNVVDQKELKIVWMYRSTPPVGRLATLDIHYLVGTPQEIERFEERHELGLFTDDEMRAAFRDAGFTVSYDAAGLFGRGLYWGRRRP
jgi:ubiquinone/menaquinone biosynthesis C-methylase UbiE